MDSIIYRIKIYKDFEKCLLMGPVLSPAVLLELGKNG